MNLQQKFLATDLYSSPVKPLGSSMWSHHQLYPVLPLLHALLFKELYHKAIYNWDQI